MSSLRAVLTYHSLDDSGSPISVSPSAFASHVRWLGSSGVRVLPLEELWNEVRSGVDSSGDAVALTFDDGFCNFAEHGAPVLQEFGFPCTLFVVSRHVGGDNRWGSRAAAGIPVLPLLDWSTLGRLCETGVSVGGHTRSHCALDLLPPGAVEQEIVGGGEDIMTNLGVRPTAFAYPYGAVSSAARSCVARTFALGVTTEMRALAAPDDPALLPRLDAYYLRRENGLHDWGSVRFRAYVRLRSTLRSARARFAPTPSPLHVHGDGSSTARDVR